MSESIVESPVIERGDMPEELWIRLLHLASAMGGQVVNKVQNPELLSEQNFVGISDFTRFAVEDDINVAGMRKSYVGLTRIAIEQENYEHPVSQLPHIRLDGSPEKLNYSFITDGSALLLRVEMNSLKAFVEGFDEHLNQVHSKGARVQLQSQLLPRTIGVGVIDHYRRFVNHYFDNSQQ